MPLPLGWKKYAVIGVSSIAVLSLATWGTSTFIAWRAVKNAKAALDEGLGALAADIIEPYRYQAPTFSEGCNVLLGAYYRAYKADKLMWAAQYCFKSGVRGPEVALATASAHELMGQDKEAIEMLGRIAPSFPQIPDLYFKMAQLSLKTKDKETALLAFRKVAERVQQPDQIMLDTFAFFSSLQFWGEARMLADRLKTAPIQSPEIKLALARALKNSGDVSGAQVLADQARSMLPSVDAQTRANIEKNYHEFFSNGSNSASAPTPQEKPGMSFAEALANPPRFPKIEPVITKTKARTNTKNRK